MAKIVIIGGGASGMCAAIAASWENPACEVLIIEHKNMLGKKILSTGNGRCNFTNAYMEPSCFYSDSMDVVEKMLSRFGTKETLDFFEKLGVYPKDRNGYYYPRSDQAQTIQQLLQLELKSRNVTCKTDVHVTKIERNKKGFRIFTDQAGQSIHADKLILACGGRAAAVLGSDGSGYTLAKMLGHSLSPVVPALVQLIAKNKPLEKASGVRTEAKVEVYERFVNGKNGPALGSDTGELQITAYGISGIPVFQISRLAAKLLYAKKTPIVRIDFFPGITAEDLCNYLKTRIKDHETYTITDTKGFDNAQVSAGGVRLTEIDPDTMESKLCKDLYLAGELLDVDGICGGYNLQWAWASGYLAGKNAAKKIKKQEM